MTEPLLQVRDLSVLFPARRGAPPVKAVERLSFEIAPGQTLGLVGQSGSGKTTAGRAILQLQKASEGSVKLLGQELTTMRSGECEVLCGVIQFAMTFTGRCLTNCRTYSHTASVCTTTARLRG